MTKEKWPYSTVLYGLRMHLQSLNMKTNKDKKLRGKNCVKLNCNKNFILLVLLNQHSFFAFERDNPFDDCSF